MPTDWNPTGADGRPQVVWTILVAMSGASRWQALRATTSLEGYARIPANRSRDGWPMRLLLIPGTLLAYYSGGGPIFSLPFRDNPQRLLRQRPLQGERVRRLGPEPQIDFVRRRQNDRHRLFVNRRDDRVCFRGQKAEELMV